MRKIFFLIFCASFISCDKFVKSTENILFKDNSNNIPGKYHTLTKEKHKIFLPEEFKYLSMNEYKNFINKIDDTLIKGIEKNRIAKIEEMKQKIYFFEHFDSGSIINVLPTDFVSFNKNDAKYMLAIISKFVKQGIPTNTDLENVVAEFKSSDKTQIFKAVFKIHLPNQKIDTYKYVYFISQKKNSLFLTLETPVLIDYDQYIFKTKL